ncbi:asparagine synthase (glutamine-hydrolyzing) [Gammaproteobacteria bacterium 45_16_T64]|nr:asparagine synthase (glutamine-hydrolyzing) [Gammaproteobacteria bacterium 45_16_T64]
MCGIAGFTRFHRPTGDIETLRNMGNAIFHRGPDAGGEYLDEHVGLCHRRLSILDLSDAGNQPMHSHCDDFVMVFNGEIYNFQEIRDELIEEGVQFNTHTDTEVLLALYKKEGEALVEKINGMFAFAIWDKKQQTLFIARDRLGKKPLYFFHDDDYFVFGSELKALQQVSATPKQLRPDAIYDFFTYQYIPDPKTIFDKIFKLEPGHTLTINGKGLQKKQYWDLSFAKSHQGSADEISQELLDLVEQSVKERMVSDVPLGAFLSGGVDSSGVVGLMAKNSDKPVTTCSIGFDSKKYDEVEFAKRVAEQFATDHHEFTVKNTVEDQLSKIASFFDEPFADPSLVPTFFVSELARQKVTVALAGDGGDEGFAGYSKYATDDLENRLRNLFPKALRKTLFPSIAKFFEGSKSVLGRKAHTLLYTLSIDPAYGFFLTNSFFSDRLWNRLINDEFREVLGDYHPSSLTTKHYNNADTDDHLDKILYTDIKTYLPGDILVKVDRMSMANSLEVRAPLLDYKVIEYAATVPSSLKFKKGDKKHILKKAFSKLLTHDTLYRKKMGFSVPLAQWLRNEIKQQAEDTLFSTNPGLSLYFKMDEVRKIWDEHQSNQSDYSTELWSMLMFQLWFNRYAN